MPGWSSTAKSYNFKTLRSELSAKGYSFNSEGDSEVLLAAYAAWGLGFVTRIEGMFALAIYDQKQRQLVLARDISGKKPLYYKCVGPTVWFASEPKALVAAGIPERLDEEALPWVFTTGYIPAPRTALHDIEQLEPATIATFNARGHVTTKRYWKPSFTAAIRVTDEKVASKTIRELLRAAVQKRLVADVPLGAFLSGGVDSTIVVGLMSQLMGQKVQTFSVGFAGHGEYDESHYARVAAKAFHTEHHELQLETAPFEWVERLVHAHDAPFGDSSALPMSMVSHLARQHVTVALSGDGGDELFCGYRRFLVTHLASKLPAFGAKSLLAVTSSLLRLPSGSRSLAVKVARFLSVAQQPLGEQLVGFNAFFGTELHQLFTPEYAAKLDLTAPLRGTQALLAGERPASALALSLAHNFLTYLPEDLLVKADRASMAHGLEVRSPFLDRALIDYASRQKDSFWCRGFEQKWLLKEVFADLLPPEIRARKKMGFSIPVDTWLKTCWREPVHELLEKEGLYAQYLQPRYVQRLVKEHLAGQVSHGQRLFLLLTFEVWLRQIAARQSAHTRAVAA